MIRGVSLAEGAANEPGQGRGRHAKGAYVLSAGPPFAGGEVDHLEVQTLPCPPRVALPHPLRALAAAMAGGR